MAEYVRKNSATPEKDKKKERTFFKMIKTIDGHLVVEVDYNDFSGPKTRLDFKWNEPHKIIPVKLALGVFVTGDALNMMRKGLFTFEDVDILVEMAEDLGYYIPEDLFKYKYSDKDIRTILVTNRIEEVEKLFINADATVKRNILSAANVVFKELTHSTISFLEEKLGVAVNPINWD